MNDFQSPPPEEDARVKRVFRLWKIFVYVYLLTAGLVMVLWYFHSGGPLEALCEWQSGFLNGRCSITLSALICLVPCTFLLIPIKMLVEKMTGVKLPRQGKTKLF